jgi:transposase
VNEIDPYLLIGNPTPEQEATAQQGATPGSPTPEQPELPLLQKSKGKRGRKPVQVPLETCEEILRLNDFYSVRQIAKRVSLRRELVTRVLQAHGRAPLPAPSSASKQESKLDRFRELIAQRVQKRLTTTRILREIRKVGYQGRRSILGVYVRSLRIQMALVPRKGVKRRFETDPGEEMQIDWSPYDVPIGRRTVRIYVLGCLLAWSRKLYVRAYRDERQSTLLEALASAFEYFDGVAARAVLDNMATAVVGRVGSDRNVLWNQRFLDFVRHYGTAPFACKVNDPDRKGKKEKSFRLLFDDFIKATEFASWDDLHEQLRIWLDETPEVANLRVHGTTGRVPNEAFALEQPHLVRLPAQRFAVHEESARGVDTDSTLWIRGTPYTVPAALADRSVAVRLFAEHFEVLDPLGRVAFSRCYVPDEEKGKLVIDKTHYANLPRRPRGSGSGERLDEAFLRRFPELQALVDGLKRRMKSLAPIHLRRMLRQCDRYGQEAFLTAARRAQGYRRFDALAIERILEREHPETAAELSAAEPIAPVTGHGAAALGEVDCGSLESFAALDEAGTTTNTSCTKETNSHGS